MSDTALKHIEHLAVTIGPRGSTTPKEKEAHDYVQQVMNDLGCAPRAETFQSGTSPYTPFALALGTALVAEALFWLMGRTPNAGAGALAAAALALAALASVLRELQLTDNPLRWCLPVAPSQNVIGVTPPRGEVRHKVVVMAHVDTHRTPLIWSSPNSFKAYRVVSALAFLSLLALCVMFVVGAFTPAEGLRRASLIPAALLGLAFLMTVQGHNTKFTAGANDNASGVGVMLALAERLKQEPLQATEVWWVATGCEEVGAYGSADFVRRHKADLVGGAGGSLIVVDNVAGKDTGPVYLEGEGLLIPVKYPPEMLALAQQIAGDHPELKSRAHTQQGASTDALPALQAGIKCLAFVGYNRRGWVPDWHNASDVFAHVDADAVDRTEKFVWEVLQKLDAA